MAKRITQETFDSVVKENMEDFEMDATEAVEDAVKQFDAQGVDLCNIVRDMCLQNGSGEGSVHTVLAALKTIEESINPLDKDKLNVNLEIMTTECNIDLPHRCLAGNNNGFSILFKVLETVRQDEDLLKTCLVTFAALLNGQPDIIDNKGMEYFCEMLKSESSSPDIMELVIRIIRLTCIMHEKNRQIYVANELISLLISCLQNHKSSGVVKESCSALRALTLDDDVRVPFGKAHEHAKMIVTEANALKTILDISQEYIDDKSVLGELFSTLGRLAVRNEFCQEIMDLGGLDMMMKSLQSSMNVQSITKQIIGVLKTIAGNDNVKVAIIQAGGAELIIACMAKHQVNAQLCENACAALGAVALRNPKICEIIMVAGGAQGILQTMKVHKGVSGVQKQACMASRNIVARNREYCETFLELGAEDLINEAIRNHRDCDDEAKAALRDLGCKVELKELWKGEKGDLQR